MNTQTNALTPNRQLSLTLCKRADKNHQINIQDFMKIKSHESTQHSENLQQTLSYCFDIQFHYEEHDMNQNIKNKNSGESGVTLADTSQYFNPCPSEPGYILSLQTV